MTGPVIGDVVTVGYFDNISLNNWRLADENRILLGYAGSYDDAMGAVIASYTARYDCTLSELNAIVTGNNGYGFNYHLEARVGPPPVDPPDPPPDVTYTPDPAGGGPDSPPTAGGSGPAPSGSAGTPGVVILHFVGLPLPICVIGAKAPVTVWTVAPSSVPGAAPVRGVVVILAPASEGDHLPNELGRQYEVEAQPVTGFRTPPRTAYIGAGGTQVITLSYTPAATPGLLRDPVRVQLGQDSSGLFIDDQVTLDYLERSTVSLHTAYTIGTEVTPNEGLTGFEFVSSSLDRDSGLVTYTGRTVLGRLADAYPFPGGLFPVPPPGGYTPRELLEALLTAFRAAGLDWLSWEDLPELYLRGAGGPILPTIDALVIEKPDKAPGDSAQAILRRFFEVFAGYGFRASAAGRLEVTVPSWHPPASQATALNKALVTSAVSPVLSTFTLQADQPMLSATLAFTDDGTDSGKYVSSTQTITALTSTMQDVAPDNGYLQVHVRIEGTTVTVEVSNYADAPFRLGLVAYDGVLRAPDVILSDLDLMPGGTDVIDEGDIVNVATVTSQGYVFGDGDAFPQASVRLKTPNTGDHYTAVGVDVLGAQWKPLDGVTIGGDTVSITVNAKAYATPNLGSPHELTAGQQVLTLPAKDGASVTVDYNLAYSAFSNSISRVTFTYHAGDGKSGPYISVTPQITFATSPTQYAWIWDFTAAGQVFGKETVTRTATYGETDTDLGGLASSRSTYGRRSITVDTGVFAVSSAVLLSMARALVQDRMNPRTVTTVNVAPPYRLRPEHRLAQTPDLLGSLRSWTYSEQHTPQQSRSSLTATLAVERALTLTPTPLPGGGTITPATERRYGRARWGTAHTEAT